MGVHYEKKGSVEDFEKALEYYQKAAKLGYSLAQLKMAEIYFIRGKTKKICEEDVFWLEKACKNGVQKACEHLEERKRACEQLKEE